MKVSQPAWDSLEHTSRPRISRCPISVHTRGDQAGEVDDPAGLADLHRQRARGDERVGAGVQRPAAERLDLASRSLAMVETCDFDHRVIPRVSTSFSIRRVDTPSR